MPTRTSLRLMDLVFAAATEKIFEKGLLPGWFSTHFYMNKVISGNKLAKITLQQLKTHIQQLNAEPSLGICLVGDSPASHSYVSRKLKACDEIGIRAHLHYFPYHTAQKALISHISGMQQDGILVQVRIMANEATSASSHGHLRSHRRHSQPQGCRLLEYGELLKAASSRGAE